MYIGGPSFGDQDLYRIPLGFRATDRLPTHLGHVYAFFEVVLFSTIFQTVFWAIESAYDSESATPMFKHPNFASNNAQNATIQAKKVCQKGVTFVKGNFN